MAMMTSGCGSSESSSVTESRTEGTTTVSVTTTVTTTTTPAETFGTTQHPAKEASEYGKVIALTFDDGPNTTCTPLVLDLLEKYNARASFFVIGDNITEESAQVMKRAYGMGCEINSHSRTHSDMKKMTAEEIKAEMSYTSELVEKYIGEPPRFFRPPYIAVNQTMFDSIDLPFINGKGCNDWEEKVTAQQRIDKVLEVAEDGDIILLHDQPSNYQTVEALETIIPELQKQGYELVTLTELFYAKGITPVSDSTPKIYSNCMQEGNW
ncbi:Peptidoglycan/xylan/chitin deacetylase, PgdA/CDA1 family [Ruminococcaceae bacterium FB2012]|nr:Peptidoglycan/xylan/chitin deacetylase, PgdA/CDA1 family [Ruminococcaceae bacterium FB2012]